MNSEVQKGLLALGTGTAFAAGFFVWFIPLVLAQTTAAILIGTMAYIDLREDNKSNVVAMSLIYLALILGVLSDLMTGISVLDSAARVFIALGLGAACYNILRGLKG